MLIYIYHFIDRLIWASTNQFPYQIESTVKPTRYTMYNFERIITYGSSIFSKINHMCETNSKTHIRYGSNIAMYCRLDFDKYTHVYRLSRNNPYEGGTRGMFTPSVIIRQEGYFINRG